MSTMREKAESMFSLKVDNLAFSATQEDVFNAFSKFGEVGDIFIPLNKEKKSRGFAFVR